MKTLLRLPAVVDRWLASAPVAWRMRAIRPTYARPREEAGDAPEGAEVAHADFDFGTDRQFHRRRKFAREPLYARKIVAPASLVILKVIDQSAKPAIVARPLMQRGGQPTQGFEVRRLGSGIARGGGERFLVEKTVDHDRIEA